MEEDGLELEHSARATNRPRIEQQGHNSNGKATIHQELEKDGGRRTDDSNGSFCSSKNTGTEGHPEKGKGDTSSERTILEQMGPRAADNNLREVPGAGTQQGGMWRTGKMQILRRKAHVRKPPVQNGRLRREESPVVQAPPQKVHQMRLEPTLRRRPKLFIHPHPNAGTRMENRTQKKPDQK